MKGEAVVDPTGCGDAFRGALLFGLEQGWPLARCAALGNQVGALKIATRGGQNYTLSAEQIAGLSPGCQAGEPSWPAAFANSSHAALPAASALTRNCLRLEASPREALDRLLWSAQAAGQPFHERLVGLAVHRRRLQPQARRACWPASPCRPTAWVLAAFGTTCTSTSTSPFFSARRKASPGRGGSGGMAGGVWGWRGVGSGPGMKKTRRIFRYRALSRITLLLTACWQSETARQLAGSE